MFDFAIDLKLMKLAKLAKLNSRVATLILILIALVSQTSCNIKFGESDEGEILIQEATGSKVIIADTKSCLNFTTGNSERDIAKSYIFFNKVKFCWGEGQNIGARMIIRDITLTIPKGPFSAYSKTLDEAEVAFALDVNNVNTLCSGCEAPDFGNGFAGAIVPQGSSENTQNGCVILNASHSGNTCGRLIYGGISFAGLKADDPPPASAFEIGRLIIKGEVEDGDDIRQIQGQIDVTIEYN